MSFTKKIKYGLILLFFSFFILAKAQNRKSATPWLGISIAADKKGVLVNQVMPETPAEKAGLQAGDIVLEVSGKSVSTPKGLIKLVSSLGIGNKVSVVFLRNNSKEKRNLYLEARPSMKKMLQNTEGKAAPGLALPVLMGQDSGSLASHKGQVVLLNFWATWCPACKQALPILGRFAKSHPDVKVFTISNEEESALRGFFKQEKPDFNVLRDPEQKAYQDYHIAALPSYILIDKKGVIVGTSIGAGQPLEQLFEHAEQLTKIKR